MFSLPKPPDKILWLYSILRSIPHLGINRELRDGPPPFVPPHLFLFFALTFSPSLAFFPRMGVILILKNSRPHPEFSLGSSPRLPFFPGRGFPTLSSGICIRHIPPISPFYDSRSFSRRLSTGGLVHVAQLASPIRSYPPCPFPRP